MVIFIIIKLKGIIDSLSQLSIYSFYTVFNREELAVKNISIAGNIVGCCKRQSSCKQSVNNCGTLKTQKRQPADEPPFRVK